MIYTTYQHQPTCSIARIAQNTSVGVAGNINLTATTNQQILPGDGILIFVSNKGVNNWTAMYGPDDVNGQKTISGQNSAGQLGSPNVQARSAGGTAAHLVWAGIAGGTIAANSNFQVFINSGNGTLLSVFRIRGAPRLENHSALTLTNGIANTVYGVGTWRSTGANQVTGIGGYRRNLVLVMLITSGIANNIINGTANYFQLIDSVYFNIASSTGLSPSSIIGTLTYWNVVDPVAGNQFLIRFPLATPNATITGMRFVI
ncbi:MAG: hypothetical protein EBT26_05310 [Microbacteriaceae bacterium]|nr:hypothetical protein [Microbacteriaceae bacterium]NBS61444.1 hypothetical protein [Microbacteriaceae bacterium]